MTKLILLIAALLVTGCSTAPRTKFSWTEKEARVMIDPQGIPAEHMAMIEAALLKSERFALIERPTESGALDREAEATTPEMRKTRWADWAKKYDIGGVVVAHVQCSKQYKGDKTRADLNCLQYLAVMNASTGKEVAMAEGENDAPAAVAYEYLVPDWDDVAATLAKRFTKNQEKLSEVAPEPKREVAQEVAKAEPKQGEANERSEETGSAKQ